MCENCGCGQPGEKAVIRIPGEDKENGEILHNHGNGYYHSHSHGHDSSDHHHSHTHRPGDEHTPDHEHNRTPGLTVPIEKDILYTNNLIAERNRGIFEAKNITAINLMSSPGSGKTTLLERTILSLKEKVRFYVIEGDQQTMTDAERIKITGVPVVQINTGYGCHLDAEMINRAVKKLVPENGSVILIENVGNLVCPSLFDLGENFRVVVMSVTEGEDKPLKYPDIFRSANLCIMNKTDLLPFLDYDISKALEYGRQVNSHLKYIQLSAKSGDGLVQWYEWIVNNCLHK